MSIQADVIEHKSPLGSWRIQALVIGLFVIGLITLGFFMGESEAKRVDSELRYQLSSQATTIAETLDPLAVERLTFTESDATNPAFLRLRDRMKSHARLESIRSLYSVALRDGKLYFGPESLDPDDPYASRPGTVYVNPPEAISRAFENKTTVVEGPYTDEYGTFVSAFAPVMRGGTKAVRMVVGVDLPAEDWVKKVNEARRFPILVFIGISLAVLIAWPLVRWKLQKLKSSGTPGFWHLAPTITLVAGLIITAALVYITVSQVTRERNAVLQRLVDDNVHEVRHYFSSIQDFLRQMAQYEALNVALPEERFRSIASSALETYGIQALGWAPRVYSDPKKYRAWEWNAAGERVPVKKRDTYFPVQYAEPLQKTQTMLGFDFGAESVRRETVLNAVESGLIIATPPIKLIISGHQTGAVIFQPVYRGYAPRELERLSKIDSRRLTGLIFAIVQFQRLLESSIGRRFVGTGAPPVTVRLIEPAEGGPAKELAVLGGEADHQFASLTEDDLKSPWTYPLFFYGRTYVLILSPTDAFMEAYSYSSAYWVGFAGVFFTLYLATITWFMVHRQAKLAHKVAVSAEELKANAKELSESVKRFQAMFALHDAPMILVRPESGEIVDVNKAGAKFYGYSLDQMKAMNIDQLYVLDPDMVIKLRAEAVERGEGFVAQQRLANGAIRLVEVHSSLIPLGGETLRFSVLWDVTEREEAVEALKESETRWRFAIDGSGDGFWELDVVHNKIVLSAQWKSILGYADGEISDGPEEFESRLHPDDREAVLHDLEKHLAGLTPMAESEYRMRMKNGDYKWVLGRGKVMERGDGGKPLHVIGTMRDIHRKKTAEEAQAILQSQLEHSSKLAALGTLASGMAHEINNPLAVIKGNVSIACEELESPNLEKTIIGRCLDRILKSSSRIATIVDGVRAFAKMDARVTERVCLHEIMDKALALLVPIYTNSSGITVHIDKRAACAVVLGDPGRLEQVITILLSNSKDALEGRPHPRIITITTSDADGMVVLTVNDNGCGIAPENLSKIFNPFFSTKPPGKGSGLGLSVLHSIVEGCGGIVFAESSEEAGTTFTIHLPAAIDEAWSP